MTRKCFAHFARFLAWLCMPPAARRRAVRPRPGCEALETRTLLSAGGGFTNGGLSGQYFNNTTLSGTPLFTRQDDRIDFDWSSAPSVSGSTAEPLPPTNFSARWTGQFIPKYSETYTFTTQSAGGVRLFVNGQQLINDWTAHALTTDNGTITLQAGQTYTVEMDYFQGGAPAAAHLLWSSPSTPQEVIDPALPLGVNLEGLADYGGLELFANVMKTSRKFGSAGTPWDGSATVDASGWPTQDFGAVVSDPPGGVVSGTYQLSFNGEASVRTVASGCTFFVNGTSYGSTLPAGAGYNPATNTTTALVVVPNEAQLMLAFAGTQRTAGSAPNTGLTNVTLMMPSAPGSSTPLPAATVFNPAAETLLQKFTAVRSMDYLGTNGSPIVNWSDRPLPSTAQYTLGLGGPLEYAVMLANETGKDMWINVPEQATDDYVTRMAELLRYGSDGVNPYTSPQANPVYPPLNPNLKVYVEFSNEVWNYSFAQAHQNYAAATAEVNAGGSPLNYDGSTDTYGWARRRVAERTVQISNLFRSVFGDSQMMTRVRPVLEWQYGNANNTAADALNFINNYYDNADGQQHVATPHPVNSFVWGGGGGWYFGVNNSSGLGDVTVGNGSFEAPAVGGAQPDPSGAAWSFSGPAGIAANGSNLGNPAAPNGGQAAYIQGSGSFSQTVTFTGGQADLAFHAAEGPTGSESFQVFYDNQLIARDWRTDWTPDSTSYGLYHTLSFATTPGAHTLRFVGEGGSGTVFLDGVQVEDANAMYNSGLADAYATVAADSQWARAFGLHVTNYEGGFTIGGDNPTDLDKQANLDPRAQTLEAQGIPRVFRAGSDLALIFDSSGYSAYGLADPNVYDQGTPKLQAVSALVQQLKPDPNTGTVLPTVAGQAVTIPEDTNYIGPSTNLARVYLLQAPAAGTYTVTIHGTQDSTGSLEHVTLDGQRIPGSTSLPYWQNGAGNSTPAVTFTITSPGLHALGLYVDGPNRIYLDGGNVTITAGSSSGGTGGQSAGLPAGWADADIGGPGQAGSASSADGQSWTVSGGGGDIWGGSDQFNLASQPLAGDGTVVARVASVGNTDPWAKAGVMFRDGTAAGAMFADVVVTPGNGVAFQWRSSTGGQCGTFGVAGAAPAWVKLARSGNTFTASYSADGSTWTQLGTPQTVAMSGTAQVGLAVTAHNNTMLDTATFTNVAVTAATSSGGTGGGTGGQTAGLPAGWADADVGGPGQAGSASSADGQSWTVSGGGGDIWGGSDQFNFASQALAGDGTIVARVASVGNTDPWAKAGVMFRDGTAANAMFADVVVTPGNGIAFQWRSSTGGQCGSFGVAGAAPAWVRLVRSGNTFTASYSADGSTWTQLGTPQTVAMSGTAQVGLAVTAHNNTMLDTATFTNVAVTAATSTTTSTGSTGSTGGQSSGLPAGWADADVGGPGQAGSASSPDGQSWTVSGGGGDIWGGSDQFNLASQPLTGDGTIVARVTSVGNTDPWAKAGVMFRDGTGANAMFADVVVTPGNGVAFQWRSSTGGQCGTFGVAGAAPAWVKLARSGNTFTASYSADGSTWTQLGSPQTVAMSGTAQVGLAVTAHNNTMLDTATFTNVAVTASTAVATSSATMASRPAGSAGADVGGPAQAGSAPSPDGQSGTVSGGADVGGGLQPVQLRQPAAHRRRHHRRPGDVGR